MNATTRNNDGIFTLRCNAELRNFEVKGAKVIVTFTVHNSYKGVEYTKREVSREKAREMYRGALQGGFKPAYFCGCGNEMCEAEIAHSRKVYGDPLCASCLTDTMEDEAERRWAESDI